MTCSLRLSTSTWPLMNFHPSCCGKFQFVFFVFFTQIPVIIKFFITLSIIFVDISSIYHSRLYACIYLFTVSSLFLSVYLSISIFLCLSIYLSLSSYVCLPIYISISLILLYMIPTCIAVHKLYHTIQIYLRRRFTMRLLSFFVSTFFLTSVHFHSVFAFSIFFLFSTVP